MDPRNAPRGKLPYIEDDGDIIPDSANIRHYLETKYVVDFDIDLNDRQRAIGHAAATMIEERLYWAIVYSRWMDDTNWPRIRAGFFAPVPAN